MIQINGSETGTEWECLRRNPHAHSRGAVCEISSQLMTAAGSGLIVSYRAWAQKFSTIRRLGLPIPPLLVALLGRFGNTGRRQLNGLPLIAAAVRMTALSAACACL